MDWHLLAREEAHSVSERAPQKQGSTNGTCGVREEERHWEMGRRPWLTSHLYACLLYTSDAADDWLVV